MIEKILKDRFGADSIMIEIARCESRGLHQFAPDGSVLRGIQNHQDVGLFQINEHYHLAAAEAIGIDIYTLSGNIDYAEYLYQNQGTKPWNWSKPCWGK